jgi:hypothetical protein
MFAINFAELQNLEENYPTFIRKQPGGKFFFLHFIQLLVYILYTDITSGVVIHLTKFLNMQINMI